MPRDPRSLGASSANDLPDDVPRTSTGMVAVGVLIGGALWGPIGFFLAIWIVGR